MSSDPLRAAIERLHVRHVAFLFAIDEGEQLGGSAPVSAANPVIEIRATRMSGH